MLSEFVYEQESLGDKFIQAAMSSCKHERNVLYNLGFIMTLSDPLGLMEILAILSVEGQVFRLSMSESSNML